MAFQFSRKFRAYRPFSTASIGQNGEKQKFLKYYTIMWPIKEHEMKPAESLKKGDNYLLMNFLYASSSDFS
jgi:hypothetical protein